MTEHLQENFALSNYETTQTVSQVLITNCDNSLSNQVNRPMQSKLERFESK